METNALYIILGFIEGFGLIISPCILPIIPIFLALSLSSSKWRLAGMVAGFTFVFGVLIFFSRQLVTEGITDWINSPPLRLSDLPK